MRQSRLTILACLTVALAAATGCGGGGGSAKGVATSTAPTTASTAVAAAPASVTVSAKEYGFDAPAEIEGGVVALTLKNDGKRTHEAVFVAAGDTGTARLKKDLTPIVRSDGKPTPAYLRFAGGVSLVPGGTTAASTLALPPGRYVIVCTLTDADTPATEGRPAAGADRFHFERGMSAELTVKAAAAKPGAATAGPGAPDGTVTARDWSFDLPPLASGSRTVLFRNDGMQDHSLSVAEFPEGLDAAAARTAFEALLAADADHPPPEGTPAPADVAFAGPLSAGGAATFTIGLKPGRTYVFACYLSDRSGGPPRHAEGKGMVAYATAAAG